MNTTQCRTWSVSLLQCRFILWWFYNPLPLEANLLVILPAYFEESWHPEPLQPYHHSPEASQKLSLCVCWQHACVWPRLLTSSWLCWCQDTSIEWCFCRHTLCWNLQVKWLWCYWSDGSIFSFGVLTGNSMWLLHLTEGERIKKPKSFFPFQPHCIFFLFYLWHEEMCN